MIRAVESEVSSYLGGGPTAFTGDSSQERPLPWRDEDQWTVYARERIDGDED